MVGAKAIGQFLQGLLGLKPRMAIQPRRTIFAGTVAVLISDWTMTGTGPDGSPVTDGGRTYDVVRCQADGTWRVVVDNPWRTIE